MSLRLRSIGARSRRRYRCTKPTCAGRHRASRWAASKLHLRHGHRVGRQRCGLRREAAAKGCAVNELPCSRRHGRRGWCGRPCDQGGAFRRPWRAVGAPRPHDRFCVHSGHAAAGRMVCADKCGTEGMRPGEHGSRVGMCGGRPSGLRPSGVLCTAARVRQPRVCRHRCDVPPMVCAERAS
jgi:hypothetical protein